MSQAAYTDLYNNRNNRNLDHLNYVIAPYPTIMYAHTSSDD